jgi:hypothetical protein
VTNEELDKLKALADAATPGEWASALYGVRVVSHGKWVANITLPMSLLPKDADFIAVANPQVVKQLIGEVRSLRDLVEELAFQGCCDDRGGVADSGCIDTYAEALRYLERIGRFKPTLDSGRRVIGKFTKAGE